MLAGLLTNLEAALEIDFDKKRRRVVEVDVETRIIATDAEIRVIYVPERINEIEAF